MGKNATSAVVVASLAGLLFGFDTAVISGATAALRQVFGLSAFSLGLIVSAALWGTLCGALGAGGAGDRYGSRNLLMGVAVLYVVSAIACAAAPNVVLFAIARFATGLGIGASSVLAPVYIAEIAPARRRGALVGLFQLAIVGGILAAYLSNALVGASLSGPLVWRWKLAIAVVPAVVFLGLLLTIPQSPRWLAAKGRASEARQAAQRLGLDLDEALLGLDSAAGPEPRLSWRLNRRPILLAIALAFFNQFSGINAILYYLADIFRSAGFGGVSADLQSVAIGGVNLVATLVGMSLIDRWGRKPLLMAGAAVMTLALAAVAVIFATGRGEGALVYCLAAFIAAFALSQGAVIWVYLSEIFPSAIRARGQALGSTTHWLLNAVISGLFPFAAAHSRALPFWVFAAAMLAQVWVVSRFFPETRGVALEDMGEVMGGGA